MTWIIVDDVRTARAVSTVALSVTGVQSLGRGLDAEAATYGAGVDAGDGVRGGASVSGSAPVGAGGAMPLPPGYALDACDPDVLLLLRADGTTVAAFSALGATASGILEAAEQDARETKRPAKRAGRRTAPASNGRRP